MEVILEATLEIQDQRELKKMVEEISVEEEEVEEGEEAVSKEEEEVETEVVIGVVTLTETMMEDQTMRAIAPGEETITINNNSTISEVSHSKINL